MSDPFNEQLDAELDALLQRTDGIEPEMQDLLEAAAQLRAQYEFPTPSAEGMERGKARLLAAAADRRNLKSRPPSLTLRDRFNRWLLGNPGQRLALAGTLAIVLLLIGNGVVSLSANSLPGDPLYGVKRAQETLRYSLEQDEARREQLQGEFDIARAREVQAIQRQFRTARIELSGRVDSVDGQTIELEGFVLVVPRQVADISSLRAGDRVVVSVETQSDGTINVLGLELPDQPDPLAQPVPESATNTPTATRLPTAAPRPPTETPRPVPTDTVAAPLPTATATPTRPREPVETARPQSPTPEKSSASTPVPTETRRPSPTSDSTETPKAGQTAQPTKTKEPTETPEPEQIESPTSTPRPSSTTEPKETPRASRTP